MTTDAQMQSDHSHGTPVDWTALMSSLDGDEDIATELVQLFIASGDAQLAAIVTALALSDYTTIREQAHSLKGASANLQAHDASAAAARLEAAARVSSPEVAQLVDALAAEVARAVAFLRSKVA
jgi:histidine phosphotransfer protein HptB